MNSKFKRLVSAFALLPLLACWDSSGPRPTRAFDVFLVMGGSNAAGVQGAGISRSTQAAAWPALLAQDFAMPFVFAALEEPGCPPPFTSPLQRGDPRPCAGGGPPLNVALLSSVAIPGAQLSNAFTYVGTPIETMNRRMLGAHTQVEILVERSPTFVAIQFGDDELQSVLQTGDVTTIPSAAQFQADLDRLIAALNAQEFMQGALVVGTMDPLRTPRVQPGAYFFLARDPATGRFLGAPVNTNCSPVTSLGQPNPLAANLLSIPLAGATNTTPIDCDPSHGGVGLIDQNEIAAIRARTQAYNAALAAAAAAHGWAYLDVQAVLQPLMQERNAQGRYNQARLCQDLPVATTAAQFQAAVLYTCPVTGPTGAPNWFGALFSFDGMTLSPAGHAVLAEAAAAAIRTKYPD